MLRHTYAALILLFVLIPSKPAEARQGNACTVAAGQQLIDVAQYERAIRVFTCVIDADPTSVEGHRGRMEAKVLLGRFADAVADYTRVTAFVEPAHPDFKQTILAGYAARLDKDPDDVIALTGLGFARWSFFDYSNAIPVLSHLLELEPLDVFGNLFRGSSRLLHHSAKAKGIVDLEVAIALAPNSADVHFIVADAYTYGVPDPVRAFQEALLAQALGLETPRIHAILAAAYIAFGDEQAAATHIEDHIDAVTTQLLPGPALVPGGSLNLSFVPGRTYEIPVSVTLGQSVSIATSSHDFWDTILVLLAPDGSPVIGGDDFKAYFAGFHWIAESNETYTLHVTTFEAASTGLMVLTRQ
jgi:tetratricopeptide (TPR) repeat protein